MQQTELILATDLDTIPKSIDFNLEEMRDWLSDVLTSYQNRLVTEESIKEGKSDRAALNKLKTALEEEKRRIRKFCLAPYEDFSKKIDILISMIEQPAALLDSQLKEFESKRKSEKEKQIHAFYLANIKEFEELVPFEKLMEPQYLNASFSLKKGCDAIMEKIQKLENNVQVIQGMRLEHEEQVLDKYFQHLDMAEALAEKRRFEEQQEKMEALKKKPTSPVPERPEFEAPIMTEYKEVPPLPVTQEEPKDIKVVFYQTTAAFRKAMRDLTTQYGIKYGGIKDGCE